MNEEMPHQKGGYKVKHLSLRRLSIVATALVVITLALMLAVPRNGTADGLKPVHVAEEWGPMIRTWEVMQTAPLGPAVEARRQIAFRPTMDKAAYRAAKARPGSGPMMTLPETTAPAVPPPTVVKNDAGVSQTTAGGWLPPNSDGAVGATEYLQIVNSYLVVYNKSIPVTKQATLAQFFSYTAQPLFDPRVVYDKTWRRWIVAAVAFPESSAVMKMFVGISKTSSAAGSFYIYSFNAVVNSGDFFDFPMVGYDQDAIFVTANIFDAADNFVCARMYYVSKAKVYNGQTANWLFFNNLSGTLAAPIVLDQDVDTWFAAPQVKATSANSFIKLYRFANLSRANFASVASFDLPVSGGFAIPANAAQTGGEPLDTIDCRFANVSTQMSTAGGRYSLFNVHCISHLGHAVNRWYEINVTNPSAPTIRQQGTFQATSTSHDFNPHIATNNNGDCFVVWSATDSANGKNAMVYFGGRRASATLNTMGVNATPLFTSAAWYDDERGEAFNRWGDYSAVTIDPGNSLQAWLTNEIITGTSSPSTEWGTRIGVVKY